jgi:hypothetical protein
MLPQLPEPVRHPSVVRAAVSPSAVIVTAAGVGIGLAAQSVVLAVVLGAGAWLGRMAVAVWRSKRKRKRLPVVTIDPYAVPEPWRQYVREALGARQRFDQTVAEWPAGPLHDRLVALQPRVWQATDEVWAIAQRGAALSGTLRGVPVASARPTTSQLSAELRRVQAEQQQTAPSDQQAALARSEEAIAAQLRAAHRAEAAQGELLDRLRVLTARLDEAVTQLLELGLDQSGNEGALDRVAGSVDALVDEIAALDQGLREAETASAGTSPGWEALGGELPGSPASLPPAAPPRPPATS